MSAFGMLRVPAEIAFGRGSVARLAGAVRSRGERAFLVVDPVVATTSGFTSALADLDLAGVDTEVYTEVQPELPLSGIDDAVARAGRFAPQVVVGMGGGSALDLAKVVALLLAHPGPLERYYGENQVPGPVLPLVAVPTTAGTGSEVTAVAVVTDPSRALKVGISDPALIPAVAVVDPELTLGVPPGTTAYAGIDALVHAVEAATAIRTTPTWGAPLPVFLGRNRLSSLLAFEAAEMLGANLERAVTDPSDLTARENTAWASMLAGMAFGSAGTHLSHALQYPVGALSHTPHGLGTGLLLPYVMRAAAPAAAEEIVRIGTLLSPDPAGSEPSVDTAIERVAEIAAAIGIPRTLADIGIRESDLPRIRDLAMNVTRLMNNAPVADQADVAMQVLRAAHSGDHSKIASRGDAAGVQR